MTPLLAPLVVKADGIASGKGVFICRYVEEAEAAIAYVFGPMQRGEAKPQILREPNV